jgi:hypothetical protein
MRTPVISLSLLLLVGCGPAGAPGEDVAECQGSFCPLPEELAGKLDAPGPTVEHRAWGDAIELVGSPELNDAVAKDLEAIAALPPGAALLAALAAEAKKAKEGEQRLVLRGRSEPGGDLSMCGRTLFAAGGHDQKRARPLAYHLDEISGKVVVDQPGDALEPARIRVIFNRACAPTYDDGTACAPPYSWLYHELIHVLHAIRGALLDAIPDGSDPMPSGSDHEEAWTIGRGAYADEPVSENALRAAAGFPLRDSHGSLCGPR